MTNNWYDAEQISCCMDGEFTEYPDQLGRNEKARDCWFRFHLIRAIMRDGRAMTLSADFHTRVIQAIENEATVFAPKLISPRKRILNKPYLKPVAGLAIAATVAAVTIMGVQSFIASDQEGVLLSSLNSQVEPATVIAQRDNLVSTEAEKILARENKINEELDAYLLGHMSQSADGGNAQGLLPYVRLAGYNDNP